MTELTIRPANPALQPAPSQAAPDDRALNRESEAYERLGQTITGGAFDIGQRLETTRINRETTEAETTALLEIGRLKQEQEQNPDAAKGLAAYNEAVQKYREQYSGNISDSRVRDKALLFFDRVAGQAQLQVEGSAAKKEISAGLAASNEKLNQLEILAGQAGNDSDYEDALDGIAAQLERDATSSLRSPEQAQKEEFQRSRRAANARASKIGFDAPESLLERIDDPAFLPNLTAGDRQRHKQEGEGQRLRRVQIANAETARRERQDRREQTELESETAKMLTEASVAGGLTTQMVIENKENLSLPEFRRYLAAASSGGAVVDDNTYLVDLEGRLYAGENVHSEIIAASNRLTPQTLSRLLAANRNTNLSGAASKSPRDLLDKELRDRMGAPSLVSKFDPARAERIASASREYRDFANNGKPTTADLRGKVDELVKAYSLTEYDNDLLLLKKPAVFAGTRIAPDFPAMKTALESKRGEMGEQRYQEERKLIAQWRDVWERWEKSRKPKDPQ